MEIEMSSLGKTWILDLDGTIVKHNGYKMDGHDTLLAGARDFLQQISAQDLVIFITSRKREQQTSTEKFLIENDIRFDYIIYEAPYGERILINDRKPSGLEMAYAINTERDIVGKIGITINEKL